MSARRSSSELPGATFTGRGLAAPEPSPVPIETIETTGRAALAESSQHSAARRSKAPYARRPGSARVREIGRRVMASGQATHFAIASAIQIETGCSRATAYRALRAFLGPKIETRTRPTGGG